ncbi:MAG: TIR domain-containing protein, partial [Deltaproteobacteria bacterium]|nr:TIR domain-containing protein [Deltaproteobacteria bacterium]
MSSAEIFICYARKDIRRVKEVMDWIEKNGISSSQIFFDQQNIYGASNCANVISQAIQDCKVLVFFVSKSSVQSRWVSNEIYFALGKEKSVLPLFLEPTELPSCLQLFLGMINQLFLYEGDRKATLNHVMRSIARLDVTVANKQCGVRQAEPFSSHCRVFDENGRLQKDVFAFPILDILIRAAKRMNFHGRTRVTFYDFTAGLVRKGQLMRYVLVQCRINPDRLYERISALPELPDEVEPVRSEQEEFTGTQYENGGDTAKRKLRELLEKWMVNKKDRFHPRLSDCLVNIDLSFQKAHSTTEDDRLTEESVIRGLISLGEWRRLASEGLPDADTISGVLLERQRLAYFDENGFLSRELLDESAWEVIKTAQKLSQEKGVSVITNRVLLAACIQDENNYGTRVFREAGARPDFFFEMLLSTLSGHSSVTFELGIEVCSRIVIPVIRHAQKLAGRLKGITEKELFMALCDTIAPNLKQQFSKPPISIDLDFLKTVKPSKESSQLHSSGMVEKAKRKNVPEAELESDIRDVEYREEDFEPDVNEIMSNAVHRAAKDGWPEVKTPHLFAEMIDAATGPLGKYLSERGLDADQLKKIILSTVSSEDENDEEIEPTEVKMSANVRKLLAGGRKRAVLNGRQRAGQDDLYASFFSDGGGIVGEILKRLGLGKLM